MVMNYVLPRRLRRKRTDNVTGIEVISIIRTEPHHWIAAAVYRMHDAVWVETVDFRVIVDSETEPASRVINITDNDYHGDRAHVVVLDRRDGRSVPRFILDFIESGRW